MSRVSFKAVAFGLITGPLWAADLPYEEPVFPDHPSAQIELGQLLFYDPILSGSKTVSCATCHHPKHATGDGVSLGLGDGGSGLGPDRTVDADNLPEQRIPRNAPPLFNLGAAEFTVFFHDGRLEEDANRPSGIRTPLGSEMEAGFASALSAQSMFPVLSPDEMAGHYAENDVAQAVRQGLLTGEGGAWDILSKRVEVIPEYRTRFDAVIGTETIAFTDISDALAAFLDFEWRGVASPFDLYLRNGTEMESAAMRGMDLFYGKADCAACHSGRFQTDHDFHAIAMPQIGPGKAARFESHARDTGRMRVTGDPADAYAFRTPPLRNVAKTAPYGHAGAYATLEGVVRHHLDPVGSLKAYDVSRAVMSGFEADDLRVLNDAEEMASIAAANVLPAQDLTDNEVSDIIAFLNALTDPQSVRGALGVPETVPSGLPIDR
ncbi:cytochrome-c peroxidase [Tateyamaria sp.]|uniref:cytochrome-c peroxidase n=1 Tax=Tateyamaria sp. TaxID=1929288 RepID=UPI00329D815D